MRTIITINGKRISMKKAEEQYGKERMKRRIEEAKETFREDPYVEISWMDGMNIEFK